MRARSILAILILLLACALQFWFASADVFINFILAALIVFAFVFDIWELVIFILFAVFVVNWQPGLSTDLIIFAVIPIAAHVFHRFFSWTIWIAAPIAIVCGFIILYLGIAPLALLGHWRPFLVDLFGGLLFGGLAFFTLEHLKPQ